MRITGVGRAVHAPSRLRARRLSFSSLFELSFVRRQRFLAIPNFCFGEREREILENQQEITTLTVIWARQLVSPQPKLGPVP